MSCPGYGRKTAGLFWQGDRTIEKKKNNNYIVSTYDYRTGNG